MSFRKENRSLIGAGLVLVSSLPFISGAVCGRRIQDYEADLPGDVEPGGNCIVPPGRLPLVITPDNPVCTEPLVTPCNCEDYADAGLPEGIILPLDDNPRGCHRDLLNRGTKYILPECAYIAEVSGRVTRYFPFNTDPDQDDDRSIEICPDESTMRVDPFEEGASKELRTMGSFALPPGQPTPPLKGSIHLEVQDCRWYDGEYLIQSDVVGLGPSEQSFVSGSRPAPNDMFSSVGDWIADYNHGESNGRALMEIHEARAIAVVKPVTELISVALTNAFFAADTPQATTIELGIKMPPKPIGTSVWTLHCRILENGEFFTLPECSSKPNIEPQIEPFGDENDRCNLQLENDDAVTPLPFQCTDMCDDHPYSFDNDTFCENIHFMNPVVGEWVDPADLWMCQCPCDDPSAPGATIHAPVQGCAQVGLDPTKPEDQQSACAQVCGGQICGAAPDCRIGECHAPASGGIAQLIARGVCDPFKPQPFARVSAAGDYHVTLDRNASSFEVNFDGLNAIGAVDGTLHFNLNEINGIRIVDIASSQTFPDDFSLAIANVTNTTVVSSTRALGQFGMGSAFQIPAKGGLFGASALVGGTLLAGEELNPEALPGIIDIQTRAFEMDIFAEVPPDLPAQVTSSQNLIAHIVGTIDNIPPVAVSGGPTRSIECTSPTLTPVTLNGLSSFDSDPGDSISHYQWFTAGGTGMGNQAVVSTSLPLGHSAFVLHVYDDDLGSNAAPLDINVIDSTAPTLTLSMPATCVWPANHKLVRFRLGTDVSATSTDTCDGAPGVRIVNVTSNQPDNAPGDGNTINDARFTDHAFCIRRERTPQLGERIYTVTIEARDASGNATTKQLAIRVENGSQCQSMGTVIADDAPCE